MNWIRIRKQEYIVNVMGLGYAIELLALASGISSVEWAAKIAKVANERCDELSNEEIEKIIKAHDVTTAATSYNSKGFSLSVIKMEDIDEESN